MAKTYAPAPDRAALSARSRDHIHRRKTDFHTLDFVSMAVDFAVAFLLMVAFWLATAAGAFGLMARDGLMPSGLLGPEKWEAALWTVLSITAATGLWGLYQYWLRRIWEKTAGSRASLWTGGLATQLLLGAVMPAACAAMLIQAESPIGTMAVLFAFMAALYVRHAVQVLLWSRPAREVTHASARPRTRST